MAKRLRILYCICLVSVIACIWALNTYNTCSTTGASSLLDLKPQNLTSSTFTEFDGNRRPESNSIYSRHKIVGYPRKSCRCQDQFNYHLQPRNSQKTKSPPPSSTCSQEATDLGTGQKVLSYSLYFKEPDEDTRQFYELTEFLLNEIKILFPGWYVRIYSNITAGSPATCRLVCKFEHLFWCDIRNIPEMGDLSAMNPRAWRFLPMGDPTVDIFLSRNLDSQGTLRERFAVAEWESSNFTFHSMRDHPSHRFGMLGGMWGAKNYLLGSIRSKELQKKLIAASKLKQTKDWDQTIVTKHIYGHYQSITLAHDSYLCNIFKDNLTLPFPIQRNDGEIIGHRHSGSSSKFMPCPKKCRPFYGKHWKYC